EGHKIGVGREKERIFVALFRGPFFPVRYDLRISLSAEIVLLDLARIAEQECRKASCERGFAHAFGPGKEQRLRDALATQHVFQGVRRVAIAKKILQGLKLT